MLLAQAHSFQIKDGLSIGILSKQSRTKLCMAVTPIGPFCPFRSESAQSLDGSMEQVTEMASSSVPDLATEMTRIQVEMQSGTMPDPERLNKVADEMDRYVDQWESLMTRLKISPDFQTKEYAKLTEAHLSESSMSSNSITGMMKWQTACMRAVASNTPPPMPPPDLDLEAMMKLSQQAQSGEVGDNMPPPPPSISSMQAAGAINASPFDEKDFETAAIKDEYVQLVRDHSSLIDFGSKYDTFDPLGKLAYLDEVEKIEERWDVFFLRFKLMGVLNKDYEKQCNQFLATMNLTEEDVRKLLKKAHQLMRDDAERERNSTAL